MTKANPRGPRDLKGSANPNWKGGKVEIKCITCESLFEVIPVRANKAKCCSMDCWNLWQKLFPAPSKTKGMTFKKEPRIFHKQCRNCGTTFGVLFSRRTLISYCGAECRKAWRSANLTGENSPRYKDGQKRSCTRCQKIYKRRNSKSKYCSVKCSTLSNRGKFGPLAPRWNGGRTPKALLIRGSREYKEWRLAVFTRDKFTCQECGSKRGPFNAHHIKKFSTHPELRMFVPNGITLCETCHNSVAWKEDRHAGKFQAKITTLL